jgi:Kef-type K+ transport system membrane component KefB
VLATAAGVILVGAAVTQALGLEPVFGAFVAGMLIGAARIREVIEPNRLASLQRFVLWVAAPVFLATAGLRMDLAELGHHGVLLAALAVLAVAIVGKFAGAYLGARLSRMSIRESLALGVGMNARGVVEVVVAMAGLRLGVLTTASYTIIVLVALVTSLMAPPLLRLTMANVNRTPAERVREVDHDRWAGSETKPSAVGPGHP